MNSNKREENHYGSLIATVGALVVGAGLVPYLLTPGVIRTFFGLIMLIGICMICVGIVISIISSIFSTGRKVQSGIENEKIKMANTRQKKENRARCDQELDAFLEHIGEEVFLRIKRSEIFFESVDGKRKIPFNKTVGSSYEFSEEYAVHTARRKHWEIEVHHTTEVAGTTRVHVSDISDELGCGPEMATFRSYFSDAVLAPKHLVKELAKKQRKAALSNAMNRAQVNNQV